MTYALVLAACLLGTLPLELVLGVRVYRQPRRLLLALAPVLLVFLTWDLLATRARAMLAAFEDRLGGSRYLAGDFFSMADITAFLGLSALVAFGAIEAPPAGPLARWLGEVGQRPSMGLLRAAAAQLSGGTASQIEVVS